VRLDALGRLAETASLAPSRTGILGGVLLYGPLR